MRNDERLRTIYEVMAPYIVRNEHNWRDYLAFASQFHKHSFDNILLVYAQDEDVSILATRKQWATIGRNLIPRAKGVAVCVYRNAKLTLDYLFDVSQTIGKEIHPTDWQLSDEMKKALTERLSYAHGFPKQDFSQALYAMASESVAENYNHFLQELKQETKGHLFTEIPAGGFEAQYIQLLTDSISYFIGKKCHLPDEEIQLSDGMATVSHFNTLPLVAHLGTAVTALSKGILLEVERNIKIINRERMAQHEQTEYQSEIQGAGRDDASRSANLQQQRSRSTSGQVRPDGPGIPQRESPGAIYDFENGWQSDGDHAPGTGRGDRENRSPDAANAPAGAASADRGHHGADATPEQSETDGGGNRTPERSPDSPLTEEQPNTEVAPSAAPVGEPSEKDGSFSIPAEQPTRHFTDAEVRRNYEYILTSTNLYPPELHSAVRSVLSEPPLNPDWSDKGRQIAALFTPYGDREYQGDLLYRTRLHGEDGISFFFDEGYTYIPWNGLAFLLDAMIEDGDYPNPVVEEQPDPIGDYNIPDEVDEMGGPHRQMTIGEADFDYVLDAVAYEAGETVVEPVKPQAIVQMENDTPAAGDEPASVPDENPPVVVEAPETARPTDTAEQPTPPPVKGNTTAHKNFRRFLKSCSRRLCPVNMSICGWRPEKPTILWSFTINTVPITAWSITIYKGKVGKRCYYLLRDDFLKYNRYRRQCDLLWERQITTLDELLTYKENLQAEYNALTAQRKALYRRKSKTTPADYSEQIQALTARIRELRREITTCADIEMDCEMVQDKVQRAAHRRENPPRERIHRRAY